MKAATPTTRKFNLYLKDRMGNEKLLRADLNQEALNKLLVAFEVSFEENLAEHIRVEECEV